MTLYAELGQALAESLNIKDERVTNKKCKRRKINESLNESSMWDSLTKNDPDLSKPLSPEEKAQLRKKAEKRKASRPNNIWDSMKDDVNESINEEREMSYTPGFDAMVDLMDSGISENDILQEILRWLPDDTLAEMADDFRRQWDLDYFEESLDISKE